MNISLEIKQLLVWILLLSTLVACAQKREPNSYPSPSGYELTQPQVYKLPNVLHEISGIAFDGGKPDTVFAQQDEKGRLFYFAPGDHKPQWTKFGQDGDYEDIAILHGQAILLRSDGNLYVFPLTERHNKAIVNVKVWKGLLPSGEYESLASTPHDTLLHVLCKSCKVDRKQPYVSGYTFKLTTDGDISFLRQFELDTRQIEQHAALGKKVFKPAAITWNAFTGEWFIISSINKLLVIADATWQVKGAYPLNPKLFIQPEGMAIDNEGNLYVSNEGGSKSRRATLFKFSVNRQ